MHLQEPELWKWLADWPEKLQANGSRLEELGTGLVRGANYSTRAGQGKAMIGTMAGRAGRFAARNPRAVMGMGAGAAGALGIGTARRRGSQNYPMY